MVSQFWKKVNHTNPRSNSIKLSVKSRWIQNMIWLSNAKMVLPTPPKTCWSQSVLAFYNQAISSFHQHCLIGKSKALVWLLCAGTAKSFSNLTPSFGITVKNIWCWRLNGKAIGYIFKMLIWMDSLLVQKHYKLCWQVGICFLMGNTPVSCCLSDLVRTNSCLQLKSSGDSQKFSFSQWGWEFSVVFQWGWNFRVYFSPGTIFGRFFQWGGDSTGSVTRGCKGEL